MDSNGSSLMYDRLKCISHHIGEVAKCTDVLVVFFYSTCLIDSNTSYFSGFKASAPPNGVTLYTQKYCTATYKSSVWDKNLFEKAFQLTLTAALDVASLRWCGLKCRWKMIFFSSLGLTNQCSNPAKWESSKKWLWKVQGKCKKLTKKHQNGSQPLFVVGRVE